MRASPKIRWLEYKRKSVQKVQTSFTALKAATFGPEYISQQLQCLTLSQENPASTIQQIVRNRVVLLHLRAALSSAAPCSSLPSVQDRRPRIHLLPTQFLSHFPNFLSPLRTRPRCGARNMHSWIQFITTPTADTPGTALILHFDSKRYIIGNVHEGVNRAAIEMGIKLAKVSEIFMTGKTDWKTTGGLLGTVLTMADILAAAVPEKNRDKEKVIEPSLTVHGGRNIYHILATSRRFIFRKGMPLKIKEYSEKETSQENVQDWKPDWTDANIQVWGMSIAPSDSKITTNLNSPRKRNLEDPNEKEYSPSIGIRRTASKENLMDAGQTIREKVVEEMFGSNWQIDSLNEVFLEDVVMPAQIFVRNSDTKKIDRYIGPMPDGTEATSKIKVLIRRPWPGALQEHLPPTQPSHNALSYVIRCQWQRGKFLPEKAKALNVPSGPLWAKLARGLDVQAEDGTIVKSEMVLAEGKNGGGVVVADLPSQDYIRGLIDRPEWRTTQVMTGVEVVIWLLGPGVSQNKDLQSFINEQKQLKHIISSPDHCPNYLAFGASASSTIRLNQIYPLHYQVPFHDNASLHPQGQPSAENASGFEYTQAARGLKIQLLPAMSIGNEQVVPPLDTSAVVQEMSPDVIQLAEAARKEISELLQTVKAGQDLPSPDAEIICLGTGSALPSKYRNVSATLLRVPGSGSYLLDCGENTLGQLRRVFPPTELGEVLRDLKIIWISHLHADHHLGTTSVIKAWYEEVYGKNYQAGKPLTDSLMRELTDQVGILRNERRLCVVSQYRMLDWLREYSSAEDFGFDRVIPISSIPANYKFPRSTLEWSGTTISLDHADDPLYVDPICFPTRQSNSQPQG